MLPGKRWLPPGTKPAIEIRLTLHFLPLFSTQMYVYFYILGTQCALSAGLSERFFFVYKKIFSR